MKINYQTQKILGLSRTGARIIKILYQKGQASSRKVASTIDIPRTTVSYQLRELQRRGFVKREFAGRKSVWKMESGKKLENRFRKAFNNILGTTGKDKNEGLVGTYYGPKEILSLYERMLEVHKTERVYVIQGSRSASSAIEKVDRDFMYNFHDIFKKKEAIMEVILGKNTLDMFNFFSVKELESHFGRLVICHIVPDEYVDFDIDIFLFKDTVLISNLSEEKAHVITDPSVLHGFKSLVRLAQDAGRKVDLNKHIKELIFQKTQQNKLKNN